MQERLRTFARAMRRDPTPAERLVWRILRAKRLEGLKFRRQVPIGRYIADFASLRLRLIVELDGGQHVDSAYDLARDAWLKSQGFRLLRFGNPEVLRNSEGVALAILEAAGAPSPSHAAAWAPPSPTLGGGEGSPLPLWERKGPAKREGEGSHDV